FSVLPNPMGVWIIRFDQNCLGLWNGRSSPPASRISTLFFGSSESRLARTHPALPAPTMMKSKISSATPASLECAYACARQPPGAYELRTTSVYGDGLTIA